MSEFSTLCGHHYLALTTFGAHGEPAVNTVWFVQDGDKLYLTLSASAEVVARIHANAQVEVAPCTSQGQPLGQSVEAMALVLSGDRAQTSRHTIRSAYNFPQRLRDSLLSFLRVPRAYVEITPM